MSQLDLGALWHRFEVDVSGVPSGSVRGVMVLIALAAFALEVWLVGYPRLSMLVLEFFAAISVAGFLVELRNWRRWPAWELLIWSYYEQIRLFAGAPGLGTRLEPLMQQASGDPASWAEIRSIAVEAEPPMRERIRVLEDLMEGRPLDLTRSHAAVAAIADDDQRRYWTVSLVELESFAAYLRGGDSITPLRDAQARLGRLRPPIRVRLRRCVQWAVPLIVGLAVTVPAAVLGNL